jgi:MoaA/NifB/PqqE/SkfB family radical SAM enzyme
MIDVLWKIPFFLLNRRFGWPRMLPVNITLSPTPRCNSRCLTCNIWMKRENELSISEWDRVFQSLGRAPFWFTVSGGEPFMFKDIVPLCQAIYKHCRPGIINIPTNSLMADIIPGKVEEICRSSPNAQVIINLSLDGVGANHDTIRGIPGNFKRFEENYRALRRLKCSNLTIGVHSVISRFNVDRAAELFDYAFGIEPDSYITEIAEQRVELDTVDLDITPSPDKYARAIDQLVERIKIRQFKGISKVTEAFRLEYYKLVKRILSEGTQVIPCFAGWASAQIYASGEVWPCCIRADNLANLRDVNYDFRRIWFSAEADRVRASIRNKECHCPLANASYTNMLMHLPTLTRVIGKAATSPTFLSKYSFKPAPQTSVPHDADPKKNETHSISWLRNHTLKPKARDYGRRIIDRYRLGMRAHGAIQGIRIITAPGSCSSCQNLAGKVYQPDETPLIPIKECTNPQGCRCVYSPLMSFEQTDSAAELVDKGTAVTITDFALPSMLGGAEARSAISKNP